jgi:transcriptional regulator GlxA family with amidase domain
MRWPATFFQNQTTIPNRANLPCSFSYSSQGPVAQISVFLNHRSHLDDAIYTAQDYLSQHLTGDCSVTTVAQHVNMSPRNMSRRFKTHTGLTPGQYLKALRIEKAKALLQGGEQTAAIALVALKALTN